MSVMPSKSLKFECTPCNKIYLQHYKHQQYRDLHCPSCHQAGLLLGLVEAKDFLRHPIKFASSYVKQTLHKRGKAH